MKYISLVFVIISVIGCSGTETNSDPSVIGTASVDCKPAPGDPPVVASESWCSDSWTKCALVDHNSTRIDFVNAACNAIDLACIENEGKANAIVVRCSVAGDQLEVVKQQFGADPCVNIAYFGEKQGC